MTTDNEVESKIKDKVREMHDANFGATEPWDFDFLIEHTISLTRKECEKGENNQTYVKGYKDGQQAEKKKREEAVLKLKEFVEDWRRKQKYFEETSEGILLSVESLKREIDRIIGEMEEGK